MLLNAFAILCYCCCFLVREHARPTPIGFFFSCAVRSVKVVEISRGVPVAIYDMTELALKNPRNGSSYKYEKNVCAHLCSST